MREEGIEMPDVLDKHRQKKECGKIPIRGKIVDCMNSFIMYT